MSTIDEIKQKIDIVEIVGQYAKLTKSGRTFKALCPFHSEKQPSFFVYPEQQTWHCFGACSTGGDAFSFIMKKEGVSFAEALRLLADKTGVVIKPKFESETEVKERDRLFQANQAAAQYFYNLLLNSPAGEKARQYIEKRGLTSKAVTDFQLGYSLSSWESLKQYLTERGYSEEEQLNAGLIIKAETGKTHDRFRDHLMFPIFDDRGRVTGFGSRVLDDSSPKYINSPQTPIFDKSGSLYGIHLAKAAIRQQSLAVMVEGYMDVIMAHQNGFGNVVAPMGTSITDKQINQIKKLTRNIALALDADEAGEEAMLRCVDYENRLEAEVKVITLPAGKDPDDVIKEDTKLWESLVAGAVPVLDYTINSVTAKLDMATARDKTAAIGKLLPIIAEVKDVVRQEHYLNKLSTLAGTSSRSLEIALTRLKSGRQAGGREKKPGDMEQALQHIRSSPIEEYMLALLLKCPELKARAGELSPEYFENSENNAVFVAWLKTDDMSALRETLDPLIQEHLDFLLAKTTHTDRKEQAYSDYCLRLREKYLRSLQTKMTEILAEERGQGGDSAELAKQAEQGNTVSLELGKVFTQKAQAPSEVRDEKEKN